MSCLRTLALLLVPALLAACGSSKPVPPFAATITRSTYGIPHIQARDYPGLGYGYGYAFAEDNLCTLLEDLVTIRGERARYFGRDGSYSIPAVPVTANNVDSDFFWKLMATDAVVAQLKAAARPETAQLTRGYVAGFNRYIRELRAGEHPGRHAACAQAAYLAPISEDDLYRRYFRLSIIASSSVFTSEIAQAQPPPLSGSGSAAPGLAAKAAALQQQPGVLAAFARSKRLGSNMYGLGPEAVQGGGNLLLGNPHFPWSGTERLYIVHLTVPGKMDIMGASLYGVPLVLIGFNDHFAWSHTVSTAYRFTLYELPINPLDPTQYYYEGNTVDMTPVPLTVQVKESDGSISSEQRTLYRSQYGPMLTLSSGGVPVLSWDRLRGYSLRDANAENARLINQFFAWNSAGSLAEFEARHAEVLGVPWVNTVATGPGEHVYYGDISVVPNTPDDLVERCKAPLLSPVIASVAPGLPLLLGNRSDCQWLSDSDAPVPGIFGASHLPTLRRNDYVANMNDSYWLSNPEQPLTGYARIIGDEDTERTLRTRLGIRQIQRRLAGGDGLSGTGFTMAQLQQIALGSEIYSATLGLGAVRSELCPTPLSADIQQACAALGNWDGAARLSSVGTPVWIEFWQRLAGVNNLWVNAYSSSDPVNTPNTLNTANVQVRQALADAQQTLIDHGIGFDTPFGQVQHSGVHQGSAIPIFGSFGEIGAFTVADNDGLSDQGYAVNFGNSYIQTVGWDNGHVHAEGFITYSESTDPASPHYRDFTEAYSQQQWHRFPFTRDEIRAAQISSQNLSE
ncbi:penicillin acylase family protein [Solimonas aquatica]|nr:penicillin acylase family protein [Solimonas aquatica]